jgi:hypothetical protein
MGEKFHSQLHLSGKIFLGETFFFLSSLPAPLPGLSSITGFVLAHAADGGVD